MQVGGIMSKQLRKTSKGVSEQTSETPCQFRIAFKPQQILIISLFGSQFGPDEVSELGSCQESAVWALPDCSFRRWVPVRDQQLGPTACRVVALSADGVSGLDSLDLEGGEDA